MEPRDGSGDPKAVHRRALRDADRWVREALAAPLTVPSPCRGWSLGDLVGHLVGQNVGFAAALDEGDAPAERYRPLEPTPLAWSDSVVGLTRAVGGVALDGPPIRLVELDTSVPPAAVLRIHTLDLAVHAWDVAVALGRDHRPDDGVLAVVEGVAQRIGNGTAENPRAAFGPALTTDDGDRWTCVLARLGRASPS